MSDQGEVPIEVVDAARPSRPFSQTLVRVLLMEVVVLTLLYLVQRRYTP